MLNTPTHQAIALAGLSQAVRLVQSIARKGSADEDALAASLASTLKIDADDVLDVYGGLEGIATGLKQLDAQLSGPEHADPEQARYASTLLFLERSLDKRPDLQRTLTIGLQRAADQAESLGVLDETVLRTLAATYQDTVSQLNPRVMVAGEQRFLGYPDNADKIRALLLAGIRSAVLWRQCGGSRWKLLFHRSRLQQEARRLLKSL